MIHLHTLGDTLITVGEKEIRPSSPMVFAALLYLGVERGRRVPRAALQELLFPDADERSGLHSVRQLLYKLRQLGAAFSGDQFSIRLQSEVLDDAGQHAMSSATLSALKTGFLPGYEPDFSEPFADWLRTTRDQRTASIVSALLTQLRSTFSSADYYAALDVCAALLHHDPLNEDATLARAKLLAWTGRKQRALETLAQYSADVGVELRLPADSLRRRIQAEPELSLANSKLIGRDSELHNLLGEHQKATSGHTTVSLIWGEPGIGKTRLAEELASRARLEGELVVWAHCQSHSVGRPLGVVTDLVPALMKCRGSLGIAPHSMQRLRRLEVRVASLDSAEMANLEAPEHIMSAIADLVTSIAAESPLLLIVEDAQWIDDASQAFLLRHLPAESSVHVLLTSRDARLAEQHFASTGHPSVRRLVPLSPSAAAELLDVSLPESSPVNQELRSECVALANGNPLFIRTVAQHLAACGDMPSAQARVPDLMLQRIQLLEPRSLLLLRAIAVLGTLCTRERLRSCVTIDNYELLLSIQDLSDRGFIVKHDDVVRCSHQILVDTVLSHTPDVLRSELYITAATQLEAEGQRGRQANLLWSCAEYWRLGNKPYRAAVVLRECAAYAVELGQPRYAIPALERAQELCSAVDLPSVLDLTIRVADLATDDSAVLRNVDTWRKVVLPARPDSAMAFAELAEVRALRRLGHDIWHERDRLMRCAMSTNMTVKDRRRAARTYLVAADESFGSREATALVDSLEPLWRDEQELDALELKMLFHLTVGDVGESYDIARQLLSRIEEYPLLARSVTLNAIARAFFVFGALDESITVSELELQTAQHVGSPSDIALACARLADSHLTRGQLTLARHWVNETESHIASCPFGRSYHLYNVIMLALAEADLRVARSAVRSLRQLEEAKKLHAVRSIAGMEMLIANAAGTADVPGLDLDHLRQIDDLSRDHSEHLLFAIGFFALLTSLGCRNEAAQRLREYLWFRRRERYDPWPAILTMQLSASQLAHVEEALGDFGPFLRSLPADRGVAAKSAFPG